MTNSIKNITRSAIAASLLLSSSLMAQEIDVKITNLTKGIYFTPLMVAAHNADSKTYMAGQAASTNLQAMAEGGDISGLVADIENAGGVTVSNPVGADAGNLLVPGASTTTTLITADEDNNNYLTITAMMLPTNDGFVALNGVMIPKIAGTYKYVLNAHDAGTEANTEITTDIPALATGTGATGVATSAEGYVHIHRGTLGDSSATAGASDLDSSMHRWLNPVASVIITVK